MTSSFACMTEPTITILPFACNPQGCSHDQIQVRATLGVFTAYVMQGPEGREAAIEEAKVKVRALAQP